MSLDSSIAAEQARAREQKFWQRVDYATTPGGCHLWTGTFATDGYGVFFFKGKLRRAHQVAWEFSKGLIAPGLAVLHRCDVPACVNPKHLFVGTQADNIADKVSKGRQPEGKQHWSHQHPELRNTGVRNGQSKLTETQVVAIRQRLAAGETIASVAELFGVTTGCIFPIKKRRAWGHVA